MEHQIKRGVKEGNAGSLHSQVLLFDDEYIPFNAINKAWGKGNTDIHKLDDVNNVGAYVSKYLTKETYAEFNRHSYHISRGLPKPSEYCHDGYITDIDFGKEILTRSIGITFIPQLRIQKQVTVSFKIQYYISKEIKNGRYMQSV